MRGLPGPVIPAKAGIYFASFWKRADNGLDSRFRGNDRFYVSDPIPKDTNIRKPARLKEVNFFLACWVETCILRIAKHAPQR